MCLAVTWLVAPTRSVAGRLEKTVQETSTAEVRIKHGHCTQNNIVIIANSSHFSISTYTVYRTEISSIDVNKYAPHQIVVGGSDPIVRVYDRRYLKKEGVSTVAMFLKYFRLIPCPGRRTRVFVQIYAGGD